MDHQFKLEDGQRFCTNGRHDLIKQPQGGGGGLEGRQWYCSRTVKADWSLGSADLLKM